MRQADELQRWCQLWQRLGANSPPEPLFNTIVAAYTEPQRAYHTLEHIQDCLTQFDRASFLATQPDAVELALYLHDVIYDPQASDNEDRSAALAVQWLQAGQVPAEIIATVNCLILATKHKALPIDQDAALLVDIDLSILGRSSAEFDCYETAIRREYAWVPKADYQAARSRILKQFLDRPNLFQTSIFYDQYEWQARQNLQRSLQMLSG